MPNQALHWQEAAAAIHDKMPVVLDRSPHGIDLRLANGWHQLLRSTEANFHTVDGREIDTDLVPDTGEWNLRGSALDFDIRIGPGGKHLVVPQLDVPNESIEASRPQEQLADRTWRDIRFTGGNHKNDTYSLRGSGLSYKIQVKPQQVSSTIQFDSAEVVRPLRWQLVLSNLIFEEEFLLSTKTHQPIMLVPKIRWWDSSNLSGTLLWEYDGVHLSTFPTIPSEAVYPVSIDPELTRTTQISTNFIWIVVTAENIGWAAGYVGYLYEGSEAGVNHLAFRFSDIRIPKKSMVSIAHIHMDAGAASSGSVTTKIAMVKEADADGPTTYAEWLTDHGLHTTAVVNWNFTAVTSGSIVTPNLATPCSEILSQDTWVSGNAVMAHIDDNSSTGSQAVWGYLYGDPPILDITYTPTLITRWGMIIR